MNRPTSRIKTALERAEFRMMQFLKENAEKGYAGIDRSAQAIADRQSKVDRTQGQAAGSHSPSARHIFLNRKLEHYVHGRLSEEQVQIVTFISNGLG